MCSIIQSSAMAWQMIDVLALPKLVAVLTRKVQLRCMLWNKCPLQLKWYVKKCVLFNRYVQKRSKIPSLEDWFHLKNKERTITRDSASRVTQRKTCYPTQPAGIQESSSALLQTSPTTFGKLFKPLCFCISTWITAGTKLTLRMYFETSVIIPNCFEKCYIM